MPSAIERAKQDATAEVERIAAEIAAAEARVQEPRAEIADSRAEIERLQAEIDRAGREGDVSVPVREHARRIETLKAEIALCETECAPLEKFLEQRQAEHTRARAAVALVEAQEIEDEAEVLGRDVRAAMESFREAVARLQTLRNEHYAKSRFLGHAQNTAGYRQTVGLRSIATAAGVTPGDLETFRGFIGHDAKNALS